jgi:hypothetical protein
MHWNGDALPGTDGASTPFWSPDSRYVGFTVDDKIRKVDATGGPPETLASLPGTVRGSGTWNRNGDIVLGTWGGGSGGPLWRVSQAGGVEKIEEVLEVLDRVHSGLSVAARHDRLDVPPDRDQGRQSLLRGARLPELEVPLLGVPVAGRPVRDQPLPAPAAALLEAGAPAAATVLFHRFILPRLRSVRYLEATAGDS